MDNKNGFFDSVYKVVRHIPHGRVSTYGSIAVYLGTAGSARMVGWAMNASHTQKEHVPAHRVVNRNGMLSGKRHFGGHTVMKELLESEGIIVEDDRILHFENVFWDPSVELSFKKK